MCRLLLVLCFAAGQKTVVLDRMAVAVDEQAIKDSDIERDIRLTEFLNREPLGIDGSSRHESAHRLIDRAIIQEDLNTGGYQRATNADAQKLEKKLLLNRFGGSEARFREALDQYGLTEEELHERLLWQSTVSLFIDQRFRPAVFVAENELHTYYESHLAELRRESPHNYSFQALVPSIRRLLAAPRVSQLFDHWLERARQRARIEYDEPELK